MPRPKRTPEELKAARAERRARRERIAVALLASLNVQHGLLAVAFSDRIPDDTVIASEACDQADELIALLDAEEK